MVQPIKMAAVVIVVDVSGSMKGEPMAAAKEIIPALAELGRNDATLDAMTRVGLIEFDSSANVLIPLVTGGSLSEVVNYPYEFADPRYTTHFGTAFRAAHNELASFRNRVREQEGIENVWLMRPTVFFITDGEPYEEDKESRDEAWSLLITEQEGYASPHVIPVAVGPQANVKLLNQYCNRYPGVVHTENRQDTAHDLRHLTKYIAATVTSYGDDGPGGIYSYGDDGPDGIYIPGMNAISSLNLEGMRQ